jgi:hypothetical protein
MASATILVPSALRRFDERFSDVNAPISLMALATAIMPANVYGTEWKYQRPAVVIPVVFVS